MLTLGVDLATKDARTALCLIRWGDGPPSLEHLVARDVSDGMIRAFASDADVVAIDAPFGWPIPFVDAVGAYAAGSPWPRQRPGGLWLRRTDLVVQAAIGGRFPLSVSSDRIARPAERAARLLTLLGQAERPAARDGSDGVIEVYPAGALRHWGIHVEGYKDPAAMNLRAQIRDALISATGLRLSDDEHVALAATDHALDALVASLVGRAFGIDGTHRPEGPDIAIARREGWIYLPTIGLHQLAVSEGGAPVEPR